MCLECIVYYFMLPAMGAYTVYYFAWLMLMKPLKELHARMLKNNEENREERDRLQLFRDTVCNEVEDKVQKVDADIREYKDAVNVQLTDALQGMQGDINEWKHPAEKIKHEFEEDRTNMWSHIDKHIKSFKTQYDTIERKCAYMEQHKQDKP